MAKLSVRQRRNAARRGITCPQPTAKRTWQTLTGARSGYVNPSEASGGRKNGPHGRSQLPESPLAMAPSVVKSGRVGMQKIAFIPPKGRT